MYGFGASLASLTGDSARARLDIGRPPAGDQIKDARPEAASAPSRPTGPGLADFGLDIFGGP